ncbi:hypothetical protein ACQR1V_02685 [Bradyrhizobium oligotrophicum]|uniref:hypothetical protein n=1 Tax=Bradyrhizobium oligotrophicum TaxID=44255 RepID=UPI003EBDDC76
MVERKSRDGRQATSVSSELAQLYPFQLNAPMKRGAAIILLGLTALVSYSAGRQSPPGGKGSPAPAQAEHVVSLAKPVSLVAVPSTPAISSVPGPEILRPSGQAPTNLAPPAKPESERQTATTRAKFASPEKQTAPDTKHKVETALTAAAIVAILIKTSRDQYYSTGHPCACPDDLMRNGRACGARSAHSKPGGALPLCYPADVTAEMIDKYRRQAAQASR